MRRSERWVVAKSQVSVGPPVISRTLGKRGARAPHDVERGSLSSGRRRQCRPRPRLGGRKAVARREPSGASERIRQTLVVLEALSLLTSIMLTLVKPPVRVITVWKYDTNILLDSKKVHKKRNVD